MNARRTNKNTQFQQIYVKKTDKRSSNIITDEAFTKENQSEQQIIEEANKLEENDYF